MIAYDLLANLPKIEAVLSDPALDPTRRKAIAGELLSTLPTGLSVQGAPQTFEYIRDRIRHHRDRDGGTAGTEPVKPAPKPRKAREA